MDIAGIPVGTSDFAEIRQEKFYYIDKTALIEELLKTRGTKATLITRPRRFGKTLNMNMLSEFFDIRKIYLKAYIFQIIKKYAITGRTSILFYF